MQVHLHQGATSATYVNVYGVHMLWAVNCVPPEFQLEKLCSFYESSGMTHSRVLLLSISHDLQENSQLRLHQSAALGMATAGHGA